MNITHIINLLRAYFIENKKRLLICGSIAFVWEILASILHWPALFLPYFILFFLVCFTIFGVKNRAHFLNLPASTAEKFIHAILLFFILGIGLYLLSIAGAYTAKYLICPILYSGTSKSIYGDTNIFRSSIWTTKDYLTYAATISVFLFGSIYFKSNAFIKTAGSILGVSFGISMYFLMLLYFFFGKNINSIGNSTVGGIDFSFIGDYYYVTSTLIILFFLSLTYLRLRETEA
jgi:hypothetical protein